MTGSHHCPDVGRDASFFSQATTAIMDTSTIGGDDSFRKQQRGSQGSGGNFSQDKFSFSGSDTIEIMGSFMRSVVRKRVELFCICFILNFIMLTIPVLFQKPSGPLKKILAFSRTWFWRVSTAWIVPWLTWQPVSRRYSMREKRNICPNTWHIQTQLQQQSITTSTTKTNGHHTEKTRTCSSPQNLARCDPQSSDDLFRSDMSPSTRRSSRLASRSALWMCKRAALNLCLQVVKNS